MILTKIKFITFDCSSSYYRDLISLFVILSYIKIEFQENSKKFYTIWVTIVRESF